MRTDVRMPAIAVVCAVMISAAWAHTASAQVIDPTGGASKMPAFWVTPFVAMGDDFAPGGGAAFSIPWTRSLNVEAEASLGTDAARTSVGLAYNIPQLGRFVPYVAGGVGVQRDDFEMATDVGFFTRKKTELAVNIGAGVTIPVSDRWSYRADFRWYNPKAEWPESWRAYSGVVLGFRR